MKKYFVGFSILVLIVFGSILLLTQDSTNTAQEQEAPQSESTVEDRINAILKETPILFSKSDGIYKVEKLDSPETKISEQPGMVSPDGEKVAFVIEGESLVDNELFWANTSNTTKRLEINAMYPER